MEQNIPIKDNHVICPICFYPKPPGHEDFCHILHLIKLANQDLSRLIQESRCLKSEK